MDTRRSTATRNSARSIRHGLVEEFRERQQARAARRRLERDLAAFTSPADVDDLLAALDRYDTPEAEEMRGILTSNLHHHYRDRRLTA